MKKRGLVWGMEGGWVCVGRCGGRGVNVCGCGGVRVGISEGRGCRGESGVRVMGSEECGV